VWCVETQSGLAFVVGKKYPVYGTQWHPEKVGFEWWASEVINHSRDSIIANRQTSDFLRSEAAKNFNSFPSVEEERAHLVLSLPFTIFDRLNIYTCPPNRYTIMRQLILMMRFTTSNRVISFKYLLFI